MERSGPPALIDPERLRALIDLGLTEASDPGMERFAQRVRDRLGVPVSLVSLVQPDQQVFPGMCGLPDPWASRRSTPLTHSFCQHVVASGEPLIIFDARDDDLVSENLATSEIGVVAYAGMPLTDDSGRVLGSLCAIDTEPRSWAHGELDELRHLAEDCSNELRLRLARLDAERERERRDTIDVQLQTAMNRSLRLLGIAEALNGCRTLADLRRELAGFVDASTGLIDATLHLLDDGRLPTVPDVPPAPMSGIHVVEDLRADAAGLSDADVARYVARGARAVGFLPVRGSTTKLGLIELIWNVPRRLDHQEHQMAAALAAYSAQALERALLLEDRITTAHQLQSAMLTDLPHDTGLELAACYLPARAEDRVGGDWYDAFVDPHHRPDARDAPLLVSIGDVTGHDITAATVMGQLRAMLRQIAWDRPTDGPALHLAALENACQALSVPATGSAILARLSPSATGTWSMTWVNAGHPPPIVVDPDGSIRTLDEHDPLFGYPEVLTGPRTDHTVDLPPGTTVVFHTDGMIDDVRHAPAAQSELLHRLVAKMHAQGPTDLVAAVCDTFTGMNDDVVTLVLRVPDRV